MSTDRFRARLAIFGLVTLLAAINALAPWGERAAHRGEIILQLGTGLAAFVSGLLVARRVSGLSRWWRLLYVAALGLWLLGQTLWWTGSTRANGAATFPGVIADLLLPVIALPAVILLVRSSGSVFGSDGLLRRPPLISVIDGVVAGLSFLILAAMGGYGAASSASLPRSGIPLVEVVFALAEVMLVAVVVLIAMVYAPDRPYRTNYLLLAGGLVFMAISDRVIAYFRSIGALGGELLGGVGLILGPVLIAFALLEYSAPPPKENPAPSTEDDDQLSHGIDWAQLILPYVGFLGIAMLFAYHVLIGRALNPFAVCVTVVMVSLVAFRQVVATRAQRLLTQRLYRAQRRLAHQVHHDALTGLPNRLLFARRLDEAMRTGGFVLIFIDLDDFKEINDRFGHAAGDELLCAVGERLNRCVAATDTLARIGGDEFAILIHETSQSPRR